MNVVLYLRYSSDNQTEQSIEGQRRVCLDYCQRHGYDVVDTYIDRATSASHDVEKRHAFQKMLRDSASHRFQAVIVYKLDRFARNRYDSADAKNKLSKNGVRVVSATENIGDNPESIILESVLEGMAEFYSQELSQKVKRGMYESSRKCNSTGGRIPLGYKIENKKYVLDPATAPIVQEAFERYGAGESVPEIVESFNQRGFRTSLGREFTRNSFSAMLKNRRYLGIYIYDGYEVPGGVPVLIDQATFERVQSRLQAAARAPAHGKAHDDYLLSDKAFCGHCGAPLIGDCGYGRHGELYHYYTCAEHKKNRTCRKRSIRKDTLERIVVEDALSLLTPENIGKLADMALTAAELEQRESSAVPSIEQELKDIAARIDNLLRLVERGSDSDALFHRLNELEAQKKAAQKRLDAAKADLIIIDKEQIVWFLTKFAGGNIDDEHFRRQVIGMLVNSVTVYDDDDPDPDDPEKKYKGVRLVIAYNLVGGSSHVVRVGDASDVCAGSDIKCYGAPQKKAESQDSAFFCGEV